MSLLLGAVLAEGVAFLYGCTVLATAFTYSLFQREFWFAPTEEENFQLRQASHELWSLAAENETISHNFVLTPSGYQLHYLEPREFSKDVQTLVILLHGFPDSCHLYARHLRSYKFEGVKVVALDLPGYGGSDSLPSYGPDQMLNVVAEAIIELKKRFLNLSADGTFRCILVGHDWGGVVGYRLAAESKALIDEFVAINSIYPRFAAQVLKAHVSRAGHMLAKREIAQAVIELKPVLAQIKKSGYETYMLTLPIPLAKVFPRLCICLIKLVHAIQYRGSSKALPGFTATRISSAQGPGSLESTTRSKSGLTYGQSVVARSQTYPAGDWDQKVRLYADGLLRSPWMPSFEDDEDKASRLADATLPDDGSWKFKCPVSIIFGLKDIALDPRVVLNGIGDHFLLESNNSLQASVLANERITMLPNCGHWSVLEDEGVDALNLVLSRLCANSQPRP